MHGVDTRAIGSPTAANQEHQKLCRPSRTKCGGNRTRQHEKSNMWAMKEFASRSGSAVLLIADGFTIAPKPHALRYPVTFCLDKLIYRE